MTELSTPSTETRGAEVSLGSLIRVVRRWRKSFFVLAIGLPLLTAVVMLFTSNKYTARGSILVETPEGGLGSDLLGQISSITGFSPQVPPTEMYMAILRSERVAIAVAESLDLALHYGIETETSEEEIEMTLREMGEKIDFDSPDLISIQISATDADPQKAANIVNAYLSELEIANQTLALSRARRTRRLVAGALRETEAELDSTRQTMRRFQETYGIFSIEKQTAGTLELIATLQTQLLAARTQRDQLGGYTSESSSRIRALDLKIQALQAQIQQLVLGDVGGVVPLAVGSETDSVLSGRAPDSFFLPISKIPHLATEYAKIFMDLKVQESKYTVLATQLEQTKIDESQSIPSFDILDWGRRPFEKSGPFRTLTVLVAMASGILSGILLCVFLDDLTRRLDRNTRRDLAELVPDFLKKRLGWVSRGGGAHGDGEQAHPRIGE